jgi:hypothetical protein
LLLHHPWPGGDESSIIMTGMTAAETLATYIDKGGLLPHVLPLIEGIKSDDEVIKDIKASRAECLQFFNDNDHQSPSFEQEYFDDTNDGISCYQFNANYYYISFYLYFRYI